MWFSHLMAWNSFIVKIILFDEETAFMAITSTLPIFHLFLRNTVPSVFLRFCFLVSLQYLVALIHQQIWRHTSFRMLVALLPAWPCWQKPSCYPSLPLTRSSILGTGKSQKFQGLRNPWHPIFFTSAANIASWNFSLESKVLKFSFHFSLVECMYFCCGILSLVFLEDLQLASSSLPSQPMKWCFSSPFPLKIMNFHLEFLRSPNCSCLILHMYRYITFWFPLLLHCDCVLQFLIFFMPGLQTQLFVINLWQCTPTPAVLSQVLKREIEREIYVKSISSPWIWRHETPFSSTLLWL